MIAATVRERRILDIASVVSLMPLLYIFVAKLIPFQEQVAALAPGAAEYAPIKPLRLLDDGCASAHEAFCAM